MILRGDIYLADLSGARGSEYKHTGDKGFRPVVVIQNDIGNKFSPNTIICPISKENAIKSITQCKIFSIDMKVESFIKAEHIRTICKSRLHKKIGTLDNEDMERLEGALLLNLGFIDEDLLWNLDIKRQIPYKYGDIIQIDLMDNEHKGSELKGKPFAIVVSNNVGNYNSPVLTIVPLSLCHEGRCIVKYSTQIKVLPADTKLTQKFIIKTEQIRTIDKAMRIIKKVGTINNESLLDEIKFAISISIGIN